MQHYSYLFIDCYIIFFQHFVETHPCIKGPNGVGQIFYSLGCRRISVFSLWIMITQGPYFSHTICSYDTYVAQTPVIKQISSTKVLHLKFFKVKQQKRREVKLEPNTQGVAKDFITTEQSLESLNHISYLVYYVKFSICPQ